MRVPSWAAAAAINLSVGGLVAALASPAFAAPPSPQPAAPPPSLVGEVFTGDNPFPFADSCDTSGPVGHASLTATGVASGPYSGTFSEVVTYSFTGAFGPVTAFHATFTITSPTGSVSGTKDLASSGAPSSLADCLGAPPSAPAGSPPFAGFFSSTPVIYQANITTSAGVYYTESGTGNAANAEQTSLLSLGPQAFQEQFLTSNGVSIATPQSKEECKNGGYAHYGYKNQGQCVSDTSHQR